MVYSNNEANTLPKLLSSRAYKFKQKVAFREKDLGIWQEVTWEEYHRHVTYFALGLLELGMKKGDRVCIQSENNREWIFSDLAIQSVGGISVGVYTTNPTAELQYVIDDCQAEIFISENQEHVDKVQKARDKIQNLRYIICMSMKGLKDYDDERIIGFKDVESLGKKRFEKNSDEITSLIAEGSPDDPCYLIYTSGTTGGPKGVITTHRKVIESCKLLNNVMLLRETDVYVSFLPLCHAVERLFGVCLHLLIGYTVHFAESIDTVQQDLREVSPTFLVTVPRILEKMVAAINVNMENSSPIKKKLYDLCLKKRYSLYKNRNGNEAPGLLNVFLQPLLNLIICNPIKHFLGLYRVRYVICGGAPLSSEVAAYFQAIGVTLREMFGMSELTCITTLDYGEKVKIGTIGKIIDGWEFRIGKDNELIMRGPGVMQGYWGNPDETAKVLSPDGWLATGDLAEVDLEGYLKIIGRKKDIIITSGGKNVSPQYIENKLKASPYIREAMVIGDKRKHLTALIQLEMEVTGNWAQNRGISYSTIKDLSHDPEALELIRTHVAKINEELASVEQIKKFAMIDQELYQEEGDITATQKTRRLAMHNKFIKLIDALYSPHDTSGISIDAMMPIPSLKKKVV